jgi:hypothetical protein
LLGLHFGVLFLRVFHVHSHPNELAEVVSDGYWFLWLTLSLMIGCTAVAEERKMGLTESQFCLPVSRRLQFLLKLVFTLIFGALLGGVMPVVLETAARHYGAASEIYKNSNPFIILAVAAGVAWVGFFASTLARNFLQALSLAIVILVGCCFSAVFIGAFASGPTSLPGTIGGLFVIPWMLLGLLGVPTLGVLFIWLAYRNFCHFLPGSRRWRRDVAGVLGALLFVGGGSLLIYHRPWELLQAAEPPHGAALFSRANRPVFQSEGDQGQDDNANLRVRLPDGRVWCDTLVPFYFDKNPSFWKVLWRALVNPAPVNSGPRAFMAGSNWVSATTQQTQLWDAPQGQTVIRRLVAGYLDTVGVRSDGTLWISSEAKPFAWTGAHMTQFGTENNWRQVVRWQNHLLLLKTDGTLWHWGTNNPYWHQGQWESHWPSVRQDQPRQIGTNADWMDIFPSSLVFARKQDGTVWRLESEPEPVKVGQVGRAGNRRPEPLRAEVNFKIQRWADLDPVVFPTFSGMAYVGRDGTLWMAGQRYFAAGGIRAEGTGFMPVGRETNWLAVAMSRHRLVALKTDGTLWQWDMSSGISSGGVMLNPATRLGIHDDWMALARSDSGVVSLAADGSLWLWPEIEQATLLKLPKQPEWLGNVFGKSDE